MNVITDVGLKYSRGTKIGVIQSGASENAFLEEHPHDHVNAGLRITEAFHVKRQHAVMNPQQLRKPGV